MNKNELKEKMVIYCKNIYYFEKDKEWCFFYGDNEKDDESIFLQKKVKKLIELLNNGELKYLDMDIENEIYDIL